MATLTPIPAATDFSKASRPPLEQARAFATAFNAQLHLIHVVAERLRKTWIGCAPDACFGDVVERLQTEARKPPEEGVSPGVCPVSDNSFGKEGGGRRMTRYGHVC